MCPTIITNNPYYDEEVIYNISLKTPWPYVVSHSLVVMTIARGLVTPRGMSGDEKYSFNFKTRNLLASRVTSNSSTLTNVSKKFSLLKPV